MNTIAIAAALLAMHNARPEKFAVEVFLTNGSDRVKVSAGDSLSGEKTFRVISQPKSPITGVEFYVGDDLRDKDESTPYEFKIDTLNEEEGDVKMTFKVFTSNGDTGEASFTLKVDNGLSKGAAFHVDAGNASLGEGKLDDAIQSGRTALKADPNSVGARILLARTFFSQRQFDKAQKFAEDALGIEKENLDALAVLSSVKVQQAFTVVNRPGTDRTESINLMKSALEGAIDSRRKVIDAQVAKVGEATDANLVIFADTCFIAQEYNRAVNALRKPVSSQLDKPELLNRFVYALLRDNRLQEAVNTLKTAKKLGKFDAYTYALEAIAMADSNQDTAADDAIREALLTDPESLGVKSAQAYIALKRNNTKVFGEVTRSLSKDSGRRPETYYFLSALANRTNDYEGGRRAFESSIRVEPFDHDMYIERGNAAIALAQSAKLSGAERTAQLQIARVMFDLALKVRPSSPTALTSIALINLFDSKFDEALRYAEAATKAGPSYAAGWYTYAAALSRKNQDPRLALRRSEENDARNLAGVSVPTAETAWTYFNKAGRSPVVTMPSRG
jgi:tetratricopeptide (TPR) repeat protein